MGGDTHPVPLRLLERDREPPAPRQVVGERVRVIEGGVRATFKKADPRPNAPLLKRLIRYPYRLYTGRPQRVVVFEPISRAPDRVESLQPAMRGAREALGTLVTGNPLRREPTGYQRREGLPSVDDWLLGGGR